MSDSPRIKPKTKKMIELIDNENMSQREAYLATHPKASISTADANASKILNSTNVQIYRQKQVQMAKRVIVDIARDKTIKPDTRIKAAQDILDRTQGKPIQQVQSHSTSVNLNVEADKDMADAFTAFLKDFTKQGNTIHDSIEES